MDGGRGREGVVGYEGWMKEETHVKDGLRGRDVRDAWRWRGM